MIARSHPKRFLAATVIAIPVLMIGLSLILNAMRLRGSGELSWVYTQSNASAIFHILELRREDSWFAMLSASNWLRSHPAGDVYDDLFFRHHIKFQYPATSLFFIAWLPSGVVGPVKIFNIINIFVAALNTSGMMLLAWSFVAKYKDISPRLFEQRRLVVAAVAIASICFYPVLKGLYLGQIQILLDVLFTFACYSLVRGDSAAAGVLMGVSSLVKPQMALFLLWSFVRRDWRFAAGWIVPVIIGFGASLYVYGPHWPVDYLRVLHFISLHGESFYANQSLNGLLNRLAHNGPNLAWSATTFPPVSYAVYYATLVGSLIFIVAGLASGCGRARSAIASFLLAAICFTLASPVAWEHHFGVLLPAFAFCLIALLDREEKAGRAIWGLRLGLFATYVFAANSVAMINLLAATRLNPLQSYLFFAALGVLILVWTLAEPPQAIPLAMRQRHGGPTAC